MSASLSVKRVIVGEGGERHEREVHEREGRERKRKREKEEEGGRKREREREGGIPAGTLVGRLTGLLNVQKQK